MDIHVAQLVMKSDCSTYQSNGISFSADTASNVSAQQSQRDMSEISEVTSIKAQTSTSIIGNADLTGARFIVTDKNETQVDHLTTHAVSEYNKGSTTGVCLNLQDFQGQGTRPFAQAIPSATVELGRGDFRAEQLSTFSGAAPQAGLDSSGGDGLHITHDSQYNISARVPLYNPEGIHQLEDNFHYAEDKLFAALQPQTTAVPAVEILPSHASHNSNSTSIDESKEIKTSRTITIERPTTNTSSSISHTRESVVTKAQQTLADTNKITHTPLTLTPPDRSAHSGQLSRFGMFGRMADRDNRLRVDRSAQAMQTHAERTQETKNETGEEVPTLMGGLKESVAEQRISSYWSGIKSQVVDTVTKSTQFSSQLLPLTIQATEWGLLPFSEKMQKIKGESISVKMNIEEDLVEIKNNDWTSLGRATVSALSLLLTKNIGSGTTVLEGESAIAEDLGLGSVTVAVASENPLAPVFAKFSIWVDNSSTHKFIKTPYGNAIQSETEAATNARNFVQRGAWLYRGGMLNRSAGPEGQFWSLENPLSAGYAEKYGLPVENTKFDFIEVAVVKPGSSFITREAPGVGKNGGGGIEVVVNPNEPKLQYFHMPWEPIHDSIEQRTLSRN